jgi:Cytochrome oxidase complex assembly protein 1
MALSHRELPIGLSADKRTPKDVNEMSTAQLPIDRQTVPPEIDRWNWGAFLLNWIWGVGNNTFVALLALIPFFGVIMFFVLGAKGSSWAWRNGRWESVEHFKRVQRLWAIWGAVIWIGAIVLSCSLFGSVFYALKNSEAYQLGVAKLEASPVATSLLGTPISTGYPFGSISFNGASGKAALNFSARGPRASGVVFLEAIKKGGVWSITRLALKIDGRDEVIDLVNGTRNNST